MTNLNFSRLIPVNLPEYIEMLKMKHTDVGDLVTLQYGIRSGDEKPFVALNFLSYKPELRHLNGSIDISKVLPDEPGHPATLEEQNFYNLDFVGYRTWSQFISEFLVPTIRNAMTSGGRSFNVDNDFAVQFISDQLEEKKKAKNGKSILEQ